MVEHNDIQDAKSMYDSFIGTLKWVVPVIVVITAIVVIMISS